MTWVAHDIRDQIVDFVRGWSSAADLRVRQLLHWMGLSSRQYTRWQDRYGHANGSPKPVDRDSELEPWERQAILDFYDRNQLEGYRRLAFMMLDQDVVAVSPSSVYRVLHGAGLLQRWSRPTRKGRGFVQPLAPHQHWHIDFSYLNIGGTFYYLCSVLDGASRFIVAWIIRPSMTQADAQIALQKAREKYPQAQPQIISDNGPQFVAKDFKEFLRLWQTTHVFTSPHYPQSNGKLERFHRTLKEQAIRPKTPLTLEDAQRITGEFIEHYNTVRLHSAIGYVTPHDKLQGREQQIWQDRDRKLEAAREARRAKRQALPAQPICSGTNSGLP